MRCSSYVLLEDPDVIARVRSHPRAFMEALRPPVILDEIQNTPGQGRSADVAAEPLEFCARVRLDPDAGMQ
jgi:hypothetical protein